MTSSQREEEIKKFDALYNQLLIDPNKVADICNANLEVRFTALCEHYQGMGELLKELSPIIIQQSLLFKAMAESFGLLHTRVRKLEEDKLATVTRSN